MPAAGPGPIVAPQATKMAGAALGGELGFASADDDSKQSVKHSSARLTATMQLSTTCIHCALCV